MAIKGALSCVPKNIAPDKDPGIYLKKATNDIERLLYKYRRLNGGV